MVMFPLPHGNMKDFFSHLYQDLTGAPRGKVWGLFRLRFQAFSSLKLFHSQSSAIN